MHTYTYTRTRRYISSIIKSHPAKTAFYLLLVGKLKFSLMTQFSRWKNNIFPFDLASLSVVSVEVGCLVHPSRVRRRE